MGSQLTRSKKDPPIPKAARPMAVLVLMWLVMVSVLSIGLGMINMYSIAINVRNTKEIQASLAENKATRHYSYDADTGQACAMIKMPTPEDPDNCYPSGEDFNKVTTPVSIAHGAQLLMLFLGGYAMWSALQKDRLLLAIAFSFLTFIAWVLSSLLSTALMPLFA